MFVAHTVIGDMIDPRLKRSAALTLACGDAPVRALDIVGQTFAVRFGKEFETADEAEVGAFLSDLLDFQRMQVFRKTPTVSAAGIKNWLVRRGNPPKRSRLKRKEACQFMYQYILWIDSAGRISRKSSQILIEVKKYLENILDIRPDSKFLPNEPPELSNKLVLGDNTVLSAVRAIVATSSRSKRSEREDLFKGSPLDYANEDQSYFILYRFSTKDEEIVKSLIQINTPENGSDTFSFNHFVWCKRTYHRNDQLILFRECEGVIAKFETSYYLIGYNFSVPVDRQVQPERYYELRQEKRERPSGIGIIAFEYEGIRQNPGLISGLTITLAANDQPIIARVALLHLCTQAGANRRITDDTVQPGGMRVAQLGMDLKRTLSRLEKAGVKKFSEYLETALAEDRRNGAGSQKVAEHILKLIDNTPACETSNPAKSSLRNFGAIETIGSPIRPRD